MTAASITDEEFGKFEQLIARVAGIRLTAAKKVLLCGRLGRRLDHYGLRSYGEYYRLLTSGSEPGEMQTAVDLITTNETFFFREPEHFDYLRDAILPEHRAGAAFTVWSAACSTGEEPFTVAMVLAERLGEAPWEVIGSDISSRVLAQAQTGRYPLERARNVPSACLGKHCLKGVRSQAGYLMIAPHLRQRVRFLQINLSQEIRGIGEVDVIFLRNVMIYFDVEMKRQVVARLLHHLRRGGHFLIGHAESLHGICSSMKMVAPAVYRKP